MDDRARARANDDIIIAGGTWAFAIISAREEVSCTFDRAIMAYNRIKA